MAVLTVKESFEILTMQRSGEYNGDSDDRHFTCLDSYRISGSLGVGFKEE